MKRIFLVLLGLVCGMLLHAQQINIACVGNSITYGSGVVNREKNSYPAQLQAMLGDRYRVMNFGKSGATLLKKGNRPYWDTDEYAASLKSSPNLVFIKLGTNDSKAVNRPFFDQLEDDMKSLIHSYQQLPSAPRVVLLLPLPAFTSDSNGINGTVIREQIIPHVQRVAYETGVELVDLYQLFIDREDLLPDRVHPSSLGATVMAKRLYEVVVSESVAAPNWSRFTPASAASGNFYGYQMTSFTWKTRQVHIVKPKRTALGKPWIWRARFFGHEPQLDVSLLERGFHVVYCDAAELFGNAQAVQLWNAFYAELQRVGLHKKAVLEGMSRGGVYMYNWALANKEKVACIYADAAVLDLKSWPGGKGIGPGSAADWALFLEDYGLTEATAAEFRGSPLDNAEKIGRLGIPLLHVVGDADEVLPLPENTAPFEKRVRAVGGNITVTHKAGVGHHPHSLANPSPITDFVLRHTNRKVNFAALPAPASEYRSGAGWTEKADWWAQARDIDSMLAHHEKYDIVFLGNSITQGIAGNRPHVTHTPGRAAFNQVFSGHSWLSAGISGDRTQHVLWRLQHGAIKDHPPKCIVLTIGVNNFPDDDAGEIAVGIVKIKEWIQVNLPRTKLLLLGPLPAGTKPDDWRRIRYNEVHAKLATALKKTDRYIRLDKTVILPDGTLNPAYYSSDGIHLLEDGYRVWAEALKNEIDKLKL